MKPRSSTAKTSPQRFREICENDRDGSASVASLFQLRNFQQCRKSSENVLLDPDKLTAVWDQHADRLLLIARSIGGPAEDAVQEAFVALATQTQLPDDPMAWLVKVTRHRLLQWRRSRLRRRARETSRTDAAWFDCGLTLVDQNLDAKQITAALQEIDSPDREIIVMHLWGGMTFDAIAKVLGGSRAKAHRNFQRGIQSLQNQFNDNPKSETTSLVHEHQ